MSVGSGLFVGGTLVGGTFLENPIVATNALAGWFDMFQTDLSSIEQLYWLFDLGWRVRKADNQFDWSLVQLEEPIIERGDTPIMQNELPTRGMIAATDLRDWMQETLNGE